MNDFRVMETTADIVIDGVRLIDLLRRVEAKPAATEARRNSRAST